MKKSIWIRIIAMLLVIVLTGCSAPTMGPIDSQPQTDSSTASTTGQKNETTNSTDATENTEDPVDPTTNTETEPTGSNLSKKQKNAIAMLYYLATTTEEICISKNNRVMLEDICTSLRNEINPGAIDEDTQAQLNNIKNVIERFQNIAFRREKLQYIYNTSKANSIKEALPDPLAVLSLTKSTNWHDLAINVVYTVTKSYSDYSSADQKAEQEYFLSNWDLTEEQKVVIRQNRDAAFNYMTDIVQKYGSEEEKISFGNLTLNEEAVIAFAKICASDNVYTKISQLEKKEKTYKLFGNYWLELADAYFLAEERPDHYQKCLDCIAQYNALEINIFRQDFNIVPILPKAIVAAQAVYTGDEYITNVQTFADAIIENANDDDWSVRYFAAQAYLDLYAKTNNSEYLNTAYEIVRDNVYELVDEQNELNAAYFDEIQTLTLDDNEAKKLSKEDKKAEENRIKAYNKALEKTRETELPPLYEPIIVNCELLFALKDKIEIEETDRIMISQNLHPKEGTNVFLVAPLSNKFSFNSVPTDYSVELGKNYINIPASLLAPGAKVAVTVTNGDKTTIFDDFEIEKVRREGKTVDTFKAEYTSKKMKDYKWSANTTIKIEIINGNYCDPVVLNYKVKEYKGNWIFPDSVTFEKA